MTILSKEIFGVSIISIVSVSGTESKNGNYWCKM